MENIIFSVKDLFRNYVNFNGRLPRAAYWWAYLGYLLMGILVGIIDDVLDMEIFMTIYSIAMILPLLSASVRRFHDTGKSGAYVLAFYLIEFVLAIIASVFIIFGFMITIGSTDKAIPYFVGGVIALILAAIIDIVQLIILASKADQDNGYGLKLSFEEYKMLYSDDVIDDVETNENKTEPNVSVEMEKKRL